LDHGVLVPNFFKFSVWRPVEVRARKLRVSLSPARSTTGRRSKRPRANTLTIQHFNLAAALAEAALSGALQRPPM
jgi:hypothetical protein